jgi:hypothetical protein
MLKYVVGLRTCDFLAQNLGFHQKRNFRGGFGRCTKVAAANGSAP